jgi:hypothetical protein
MATKHINPSHKRQAKTTVTLLAAALDQLSDMIAERTAELKKQNDAHKKRKERSGQ